MTVSFSPGATSWFTLSSSSVKLCSVVSSFVISMSSSRCTVSVVGSNVKSLMLIAADPGRDVARLRVRPVGSSSSPSESPAPAARPCVSRASHATPRDRTVRRWLIAPLFRLRRSPASRRPRAYPSRIGSRTARSGRPVDYAARRCRPRPTRRSGETSTTRSSRPACARDAPRASSPAPSTCWATRTTCRSSCRRRAPTGARTATRAARSARSPARGSATGRTRSTSRCSA